MLIVCATALFDLEILGKKVLLYLCVYLLGYFLFSNRFAVNRLIKYKWIIVSIWLVASAFNIALFIYVERYEVVNTICNYMAFLFGVPAVIILGHDYLDFSNELSHNVSKISYVFYIIHFPLAVLCQYFLSLTSVSYIMNFFLSLVISYPITFFACWGIKKNKCLKLLFGIK